MILGRRRKIMTFINYKFTVILYPIACSIFGKVYFSLKIYADSLKTTFIQFYYLSEADDIS